LSDKEELFGVGWIALGFWEDVVIEGAFCLFLEELVDDSEKLQRTSETLFVSYVGKLGSFSARYCLGQLFGFHFIIRAFFHLVLNYKMFIVSICQIKYRVSSILTDLYKIDFSEVAKGAIGYGWATRQHYRSTPILKSWIQ
jgi:hypothetical protein